MLRELSEIEDVDFSVYWCSIEVSLLRIKLWVDRAISRVGINLLGFSFGSDRLFQKTVLLKIGKIEKPHTLKNA